MAQIIDIKRVEVGPKNLTARVRVATGAPLMTSEDLEGTTRVFRLLPHIIDHVCIGDAGETFKDVMGDTELAHLLEHVTVEILAQTNMAGDTPCGRTYAVEDERRTYDIEFPCTDDVLVAGALSSAVWIVQWAYNGGGDPEPDVAATVKGLVELVKSLPEPEAPAPSTREYVVYGKEAEALAAESEGDEAEEEPAIEEPVAEPVAEVAAPEPVAEPEPEPEPEPETFEPDDAEVDLMLGAVHAAVEAHSDSHYADVSPYMASIPEDELVDVTGETVVMDPMDYAEDELPFESED